MKPVDKYKCWLMLSEYDMETLPILAEAERWAHVVALCKKALERLLKGMYVYYLDEDAPNTDNLLFLLNKIADSEEFLCCVDKKKLDECRELFTDAMNCCLPDHPFLHKNISARFVSEEVAVGIYRRTLLKVEWLKSLQNIDEPEKTIMAM